MQTIGARFANHELSLQEAAELGCRACASPGGGCQFLGTAGTSQVVAEALGLALPHSALAPSGQAVWLEIARQSARAVSELDNRGITTRDILTDKAIENAMVIHAAFGGSTNLLLHPGHRLRGGLHDPGRRTLDTRQPQGGQRAAQRRTITRPCAPSSRAVCRR